MYILFHFWTGIKSLSSDFQYSRCFDEHEMNGTFQVNVAEKKTYYGICCMQNKLAVTI